MLQGAPPGEKEPGAHTAHDAAEREPGGDVVPAAQR